MFKGHEAAPVDKKTSEDEAKLSEDFGSLYLSQKLSDVTFLVGGERLHAHKTILGFRSEQFEALFNANSNKKVITIPNASPESFRLLLKLLYTGTIIIPSNPELTLQLLILARQYCPKQLVDNITKKITSILDEKNVVCLVNGANDNDLVELQDACHLFIDTKAVQMLSSDSFKDLTQKALNKILKRPTFAAPQTDLIKGVISWCEKNNDAEVLATRCTSLSLLSVSEIMSIVWPKLAKSDKLLDTFFQNISSDFETLNLKVVDENLASVDKIGLLNGNRNAQKYLHHTIDDVNGIVIRLEKPYIFNHIRMMLSDHAFYGWYSYYIEVSLDQTKWHRIIDYTKYNCRSVQNLYFPEQTAQYIKVVGTSSSFGNTFDLAFFETFYRNQVPKTVNGVICPKTNVATLENNTICFAGWSNSLIVRFPQPYLISSMQFLSDNAIFYFNRGQCCIETSVKNEQDWEPVGSIQVSGNCSWHSLYFPEKIVVYIRISGIGINRTELNCNKFIRCPAKE